MGIITDGLRPRKLVDFLSVGDKKSTSLSGHRARARPTVAFARRQMTNPVPAAPLSLPDRLVAAERQFGINQLAGSAG